MIEEFSVTEIKGILSAPAMTAFVLRAKAYNINFGWILQRQTGASGLHLMPFSMSSSFMHL